MKIQLTWNNPPGAPQKMGLIKNSISSLFVYNTDEFLQSLSWEVHKGKSGRQARGYG